MANLVFIDSYPIACVGFVEILTNTRCDLKIQVVNGVGNLEAVESGLVPDAVILAINTPKESDPVGAFMECRTRWPAVPIILFDEDSHTEYTKDLLKLDASGHLFKIEPVCELLRSIDTVLRGACFLSPEIRKRYFTGH